jgi:hypothetical protein
MARTPNTPALIPVPPTAGGAVTLSTSPFWIGSTTGCALRLYLPGIAGRHAALLEREDGFWLASGPGISPAPTINGAAADAEVRLSHGDVIELAPAARYRFDSGEPAPPEPAEDEPAEPVFSDAPVPRRRRRRHGVTGAQRRRIRFVLLAAIAAIVVTGLVAAAVVMLLRTL